MTDRAAPPIAFGHRGALGYAPENTIGGFRLALAMGATGLESDAWLAADRVPVLVHDRTVRAPGRRIDVTRRTSGELDAWGIPTLAELYRECGTTFALSLDVKDDVVALPVIAVARAVEAVDRLWLCHEDVQMLAGLRVHDRDVRLVHSVDLRLRPAAFEDHLAGMVDAGLDALNMRARAWSAERIAAVHRRGLLGFAWDAPEPTTLAMLLDLGMDGIYSDHPDRLVRAIAEHVAAASGAG
jgi:glycerophosphoryl diester phosphodiesterase